MTIRELGRTIGNAVLQQVGRASSRVQESRPLAADVLESEDAYLVVFDAPGATGNDVQVRYSNGSILVRVDRFREFHDGFEMRFPGRGLTLEGEVELPTDALVNATEATATLTGSGTLHVRVPKEETTTGDDDQDGSATIEPEP